MTFTHFIIINSYSVILNICSIKKGFHKYYNQNRIFRRMNASKLNLFLSTTRNVEDMKTTQSQTILFRNIWIFFFCFDESKEMLPFAQNILTDAALLWIRFAVVAIGKWTSVFIRYCFTVRIYGGEYEFIIFMRHIVQFYYSLSDENHSKKCLLWGFNN